MMMIRYAFVLAVVAGLAGVASADFCKKCAGMGFTADVGWCRNCKGQTSSGAFRLCPACSDKLKQCQACRVDLQQPATAPAAKPTPAAKPAPLAATAPATMPAGAIHAATGPASAPATSPATAPATRPELSKLAAGRRDVLKENLETFAVKLRHYGASDKPFYEVVLAVRDIVNPGGATLAVQIDKEQAAVIIDHLAASGYLDAAEDAGGKEAKHADPSYLLIVWCDKLQLIQNIGWGDDMVKKAKAMRDTLKENESAQKSFKIFLGRLGY